MSTIQPNDRPNTISTETRNRTLITKWAILIASLKLTIVNIYLLFFIHQTGFNDINLKLLIGADSAIIGTILSRIVKYYFPTKTK